MKELILTEIFGWHVAVMLFSAFVGWLDRKPSFLRKIYVWVHNITTPPSKNITLESNLGFVYGQTTKGKLKNALPFGLVFELISLATTKTIPLYIDIIFFVTGTTTIFIGFMLSPILSAIVKSFRWSIDRVDDIETGKVNLNGNMSGDKHSTSETSDDDKKEAQSRPDEKEKANARNPDGLDEEYFINKMKTFGKGKK